MLISILVIKTIYRIGIFSFGEPTLEDIMADIKCNKCVQRKEKKMARNKGAQESDV